MTPALLLLAALAGVSEPSWQPICWDTAAEAEAFVTERLHQTRIATGGTFDAGRAAIYVAPNGDWSMVVPSRVTTCISDYGSDWSHDPQGGL